MNTHLRGGGGGQKQNYCNAVGTYNNHYFETVKIYDISSHNRRGWNHSHEYHVGTDTERRVRAFTKKSGHLRIWLVMTSPATHGLTAGGGGAVIGARLQTARFRAQNHRSALFASISKFMYLLEQLRTHVVITFKAMGTLFALLNK
jgi:hypothetical protein